MINEGASPAKPTAVLDSNVLISGFSFSGGNPDAILNLLRHGNIHVHISAFILDEVSRAWRRRFAWDESRIEEALLFLRTYCTVVDPLQVASVSGLTDADNRVLDCAVDGGVQYLVTGDRGIQRINEYQGVSIVSQAEFLEIFLRNQAEH